MKGLIAFTVLALFLGANAYEGIMPVSEPESEMVFSALFDSGNLGQRIKNLNPTVVSEDAACVNTYVQQDIQLLKNFNAGVRECLHVTEQEFKALFNSKLYNHAAMKIKNELAQCEQNAADTDAKLECYTEAVAEYFQKVHKLSTPYINISKTCLRVTLNKMERQWNRAYSQMTKCIANVRAANPVQPSAPVDSSESDSSSLKAKLNNIKNSL